MCSGERIGSGPQPVPQPGRELVDLLGVVGERHRRAVDGSRTDARASSCPPCSGCPIPSPADVAAAAANLFDVTRARRPRRPAADAVGADRRGPAAARAPLPPALAGACRATATRSCSCRRSPRRRSASTCAAAARVAEHLLARGHATYLVDYGPVRFGDRALGLEHWIDDVDPDRGARGLGGRRRAARSSSSAGASAGSSRCSPSAADRDLPVAAAALVASPFDFSRVPLVAPLRPIAAVTQGQVVDAALPGARRRAGAARQARLPARRHRQVPDEAVDGAHATSTTASCSRRSRRSTRSWTGCTPTRGAPSASSTTASSAPTTSPTAGSRWPERTLDLADVRVPVLAVAGRGDGIAPVAACHHVGELLTGAPSVRLETAPGGHLGVLTGRAARGTTWVDARPLPRRARARGAAAEAPRSARCRAPAAAAANLPAAAEATLTACSSRPVDRRRSPLCRGRAAPPPRRTRRPLPPARAAHPRRRHRLRRRRRQSHASPRRRRGSSRRSAPLFAQDIVVRGRRRALRARRPRS